MHYSLIREFFRSELGQDPSDLFATFDKEPFAAASIGQVHRATLNSGEEVAVKIQYPGIGRAMQVDLRNLMALIFPVRLSKSAATFKGQVEAMWDMPEQEMESRKPGTCAKPIRFLRRLTASSIPTPETTFS